MREQFTIFTDWLKNGLSVAGDLIILNFLFILCSIPVFTAGAAEVACYTCICRIARGEKVTKPFTGFFRGFASGFNNATLAWLAQLVCISVLLGDLWFAVIYSEPDNTFFLIFAIVVGAGIMLAAVWLYPLIARFDNKIGSHIKNSFLMALAQIPKTVLVLLIQAAFILVPLFVLDAYTFFSLGWFWLLFGFSLPMYITVKLFSKTLKCEPKKTDAVDKNFDKLSKLGSD